MTSKKATFSPIFPPSVYVDDAGPEKGRGVFAACDLEPEEVVEISPVTIFPHGFNALIPPKLKDRFFVWPDPYERGEVFLLQGASSADVNLH